MDYKTKSVLTVTVVVLLMIIVAVFINNLQGTITSASVLSACECSEDSDCDDNHPCTEDICLYADECEASLCVNKDIENCE